MENSNAPLGFAESPIELPTQPVSVSVQPYQLLYLAINTPKLSAGNWQSINPLALTMLLATAMFIVSSIFFPINILILANAISIVCASQVLLHLPGIYSFMHKIISSKRQAKALTVNNPELLSSATSSDDLQHDAMPIITLLLPLYREARMIKQINQMLRNLNYPAHKLDVLILLEQDDTETLVASQQQIFHQPTRVLTVPRGSPRTKPRACNYGLFHATGTIIGIYDAEDLPHPDQLLEVVEKFATGGPKLACLQAPLEINETSCDPLKNFFALEYKMLFNFLLPALVKWNLPAPLSGSSNFFRRDVLDIIGHWDAYNLTEDADIGMRLARSGYTVDLLTKATIEVAPNNFRDWFFQRTRWLTGFLQTYLVHMRQPSILLRELGLTKFLAFNFLYLARLISGIAHFASVYLLIFHLDTVKEFLVSNPIGWLSLVAYLNIVFIIWGLWTLSKTWPQRLYSLLIPLYWLMFIMPIMLASYNLIRRNFKWYKTPHMPYSASSELE